MTAVREAEVPEMRRGAPVRVPVATVHFTAEAEGALWWDEERILVVADLHLEKGSSFARRGQFLPPYDTAATLASLGRIVRRRDPRVVVALGDSFHDDEGGTRLSATDRDTLRDLQRGRDWIWIAGNHDPAAPVELGGSAADCLAVGEVIFRHEPSAGPAPGEVAGHLHPAARVSGRLGSTRRRCFIGDGTRLVTPAFGAFAGGLSVRDPAFQPLFKPETVQVWLLGRDAVYPIGFRSIGRD
ncbi:MAG: ligase-associated DNA damage response endonuclease PdeM [Bauldia sp.]